MGTAHRHHGFDASSLHEVVVSFALIHSLLSKQLPTASNEFKKCHTKGEYVGLKKEHMKKSQDKFRTEKNAAKRCLGQSTMVYENAFRDNIIGSKKWKSV